MHIEIKELIEGAKQARGLTVIIDVFRAFSLEAMLFHKGVKMIYATGSEDLARALKKMHPEYLLIGERGGAILPGFDYGNSPSQMQNLDVKDKILIHTTSAGTQGIANAIHADQVITGSLLNAKAVVEYIRGGDYKEVTLVCMGQSGVESAPEDVLCAHYIKSMVEGTPFNIEEELIQLRRDQSVERFFDPDNHIFPQEDYEICTRYDLYDLVIEANLTDNGLYAMTKEDAS